MPRSPQVASLAISLMECRFAPEPVTLAPARRLATTDLCRHGCQDVAPDVELVISELIANAVEHAETMVAVRLSSDGNLVRLEVDDDGPGWPNLTEPGMDSASGRGLLIVDRYSYRWGVERLPGDGKMTWAEFVCSHSSEG